MWHIPLLERRGGRAINKMVPFRIGAAGEVAHTSHFGMRCKNIVRERPLFMLRAIALALRARLRQQGGFAAFYQWRSHPSSRGGESRSAHIDFAKGVNALGSAIDVFACPCTAATRLN